MPSPPDRLTVVETVYHQPYGSPPVSFSSKFNRYLEGFEQAYMRRLMALDTWQRLDLGWVKDIGMLVIRNEEGRWLQRHPSAEEMAEMRNKTILLGFSGEFDDWWQIPPGESFRGMPLHCNLSIRCIKGTALFTVFAVPR